MSVFILCSLVPLSYAFLPDPSTLISDCLCLRSFRPVCSTDQQTYDNICFLHCARRANEELRLAYDGVCCPRAELCTDYEDTVCDQFGVRYDNDCVFEFHRCIRRRQIGGEVLRVVGRGERMCGAKRRMVASSENAATKASTAPSALKLWNSNGTAQPNGAPTSAVSCDFPCENVVAPVCDSQGQTHQNRCKFDAAICRLHSRGIVSALRISREGPCRSSDHQQQQQKERQIGQSSSLAMEERNGDNLHGDSDKNAKGSAETMRTIDGKAQRNTDQEQHQQHGPPSVQKASPFGGGQMQPKVPQTDDCADFCREEKPSDQIVSLCDNANLTHQSLCSFARWNCDRRKRGAEEHILVHLGECNLVSPIFQLKDEKCPSKCSRKLKAVCDSNGLSHPNLCAYQMHSCHQRKNRRPFGWLLSLGECQQKNGTAIGPKATDGKGTGGGNEHRPTAEAEANGQPKRHNPIECPAEPKCEGTTDQQRGDEGEEGPICDSNGRMHNNICMFAHFHCLAAKEGQLLRIAPIEQCENSSSKLPLEEFVPGDKTEDASSECETQWALCQRNATGRHLHAADAPFCGTDFVTYRTLCDFQLAQCKNSTSKLDVLFKGPCELCLAKVCQPSDRFTISADGDDSHFVCDQNGETLSHCEFEMLRCVVEANLGHNVTFAYEGKCCPTESQCPPPKVPHNPRDDVCDSNGRRHRSRCQFEAAKCRAEKVERQAKPLEERYCATEELGEGGGEGGGGGRGKKWEERENDGEEGKEWREMRAKLEGKGMTAGKREQQNRTREQRKNGSAHHSSGDFIRTEMNISADLLSVDHLICNDKYDPVCGSDRRTYRNACHLERRNATGTLSAIRRRWAPATANDPAEDSSDGWAPLRVLYPGECCTVVDCPTEYAPVCDSEGRTHLNLCEFGYQRCLAERMRSRNLTIAFYGVCPDSHCPRGPCPRLFEPICATNGKTYPSLCELDKTICVLKSGGGTATARNNGVEMADAVAGGPSLGLDYIGECCESSVDCSDLAVAPPHFQPLCDSRGTTHADECAFRKAKCRAKRRREPFLLRIIRRGKCERRRRR